MTFPSSTGSVPDSLDVAWANLRSTAAAIKSRTVALSTSSLSGLSGGQILDYSTFLADMRLSLVRASSVSGIAAYAQGQISNNTIDIVAEYNTMLSAVDGCKNWILSNYPKDVSGNLLYVQFAGDNSGRTVFTTFANASLATFRTQLDALAATIN